MPTDQPLAIIGSYGLRKYGGRLAEEFLTKLYGIQGVRVFREMGDNCSIIGGINFGIESLCRQVSWSIQPASTENKSLEQAAFVQECREDLSHTWPDFLSEVLTETLYGWSYFEVLYKLRKGPKQEDGSLRSQFTDGKYGWRKFAFRGQDTLDHWEFDEEGGIQGMWQWTLERPVRTLIPIQKALLFRTRTHKNNPEGRSLYRNCYRDWFFLKRLQEVEGIGIERNLNGLPVAEVPLRILDSRGAADDIALYNQISDTVRKIRVDERMGVVFPAQEENDRKTGFNLRLLSGGQTTNMADPVIRRYESRIAASLLADFILVALDKVGSHAAVSSKTQLFAVALSAILDSITEVLNKYAIGPLMDLNGVPFEYRPKFVHGDISQTELKDLADYVSKLAGAGLIQGTHSLEQELLTRGSLPLVNDGGSSNAIGSIPLGGAGLDTDEADEQRARIDWKSAPAGPQILAVQQLLVSVAQGELPRDAAIGILTTILPLSEDQADNLMGSIGQGFEPKPKAVAPAMVGPDGKPVAPQQTQPKPGQAENLGAEQERGAVPPANDPSKDEVAANDGGRFPDNKKDSSKKVK